MAETQRKAVTAALEATEHAIQPLKSAKKDLESASTPHDRKPPIPKQDSTLTAALMSNVNNYRFRFQDLPAELRLKVYRELLQSPYEIDPVYGRDSITLHPAILRVSKQIRNEAEPILYDGNVFTATIYSDHVAQLWHRGDSIKSLIPRSSSRKIGQIHLYVITIGSCSPGAVYNNIHHPGLFKANASLTTKKLSLNHLKLLKLTINNYTKDFSDGVPDFASRYQTIDRLPVCFFFLFLESILPLECTISRTKMPHL